MIFSVDETGKMLAACWISKEPMKRWFYYLLMAGLLIRGVVPKMTYKKYVESFESPLPDLLDGLNETALQVERLKDEETNSR